MSEDQVHSEAMAKFPSSEPALLSESQDYLGELIY
jgi:hypothetical protein